jgi:hypothetical protein
LKDKTRKEQLKNGNLIDISTFLGRHDAGTIAFSKPLWKDINAIPIGCRHDARSRVGDVMLCLCFAIEQCIRLGQERSVLTFDLLLPVAGDARGCDERYTGADENGESVLPLTKR